VVGQKLLKSPASQIRTRTQAPQVQVKREKGKPMKYREVATLASNLRYMADFIEEHGVELPGDYYSITPRIKLTIWMRGKEEMARAAKVLAKVGMVKKDFSSSYANITKDFGPHAQIECTSMRDKVCTKKVVGTETVPKKAFVTIEGEYETKEIVEWECDPILAD
jgi:hypothetical protein